jgi:hypothetical protein
MKAKGVALIDLKSHKYQVGETPQRGASRPGISSSLARSASATPT